MALPETSPATPPSLTSLPGEILTAIAHHLNRADALSLSYTATCFAEHLERPLWRDLNLSINQSVGELPRTYDDPPGSGAFQRAQIAEGEKADDIYTDRLREKLKQMLQKGDARRWGMTETVRLINRPHAAHLLVVLDCVSANLRYLEIGAMPHHITGRQSGYRDSQRLETLIFRSGMSFPALTHVSLGPGSIRYIGFLPLLCNSAPNLTWLSAEIGKVNDERRCAFPYYDRQTQIRYLYVSMASPLNSIVSLLKESPKLEKVSLTGAGVRDVDFYHVLVKHEYLEELYYAALTTDFAYFLESDEGAEEEGFAQLRTLVLRSATDDDGDRGMKFFPYLHLFPRLQALYISLSGPPVDVIEPPVQPRSQSHKLVCPQLIPKLRECSHLDTIRYVHLTDFISKLGSDVFTLLHQPGYAGSHLTSIGSLRHAGYELLLLRFPQAPHLQSGSMKVFGLERSSGGEWRVDSDLYGAPVPLEIVAQVLAVEGTGLGYWRRGYEVGAAAWKVLADWDAARIGASKGKT